MRTITRKPEVKDATSKCISAYDSNGMEALVSTTEIEILAHKIKFPLLEYAATLLHEALPAKAHIPFCTEVEKLKTIGGNVLIGIILQNRLKMDLNESLEHATRYISLADVWYVCDIIGERTFGYALLYYPDRTIPIYKGLSTNDSNWVIRSLGAGAHYAIKKGLGASDTDRIFKILLTMADNKDKEIRQGVGWAAKTTAKFHPQVIKKYQKEIQSQNVANWLRKKIEIGMKRHEYSQGR